MIDKSKKISLLLNRLIPPFVIDEYPQFSMYIKTFLEYIEREKGEYDLVANLLNYNDVDNTLDVFQDLFKTQFAKSLPVVITKDIDLVIKNIRDYYKSKGTENSFKFLFHTIYNKNIDIYYPKFNILKLSDGIWYTPEYLMVTDEDGNIPIQHLGSDYPVTNLINKHIIGIQSGAEAYIDGVSVREYTGSEKIENGDFSTGDTTGWTETNGTGDLSTFIVENGILTISRNNSDIRPSISQEEDMVSGFNYKLSFNIETGSNYSYDISIGGVYIIAKNTPVDIGFQEVEFISTSSGLQTLVCTSRGDLESVLALSDIKLTKYYSDENFVSISEKENNFKSNEMIIIGENFVYNGSFSALQSGWYQSHSDNYFYVSDGKYIIQQIPLEASNERYIYQSLDINTSGVYFLRYSIINSDGENVSIRIGYSAGAGDIFEESLPVAPTYPYSNFVELPSFNTNVPVYISIVSNLLPAEKVEIDGIAIIKQDILYPFLFIDDNGIQVDESIWADTRGMLSENMYLQDNYYYQEYSYVLKTDVPISDYKNIIKDNVHPAGYIMFGEVLNTLDTIIEYGEQAVISYSESIFPLNYVFETENNNSITAENITYQYINHYNININDNITYKFVEKNRENTLINEMWDRIETFYNIPIKDFITKQDKLFLLRDSFDIIIT